MSDGYRDFKKFTVRSFAEYLEVLKEIREKEEVVWLRGHFSASYRLTPTAMRQTYSLYDQFGEKMHPFEERGRGETVAFLPFQKMLQQFKKLAKKELGKSLRVEPANDLEWLFMAQHYGIPTTLLDWTTDPLVALFFATQGTPNPSLNIPIQRAIHDYNQDSYSQYGAAIIIMNPRKINTHTSELIYEKSKKKFTEIVNIADDQYYEKFKPFIYPSRERNFILPYCTLGGELDRRICRQSGNFTIHGSQIKALDFYDVLRESMYKIFIPFKCFKEMKGVLGTLNINETSIYGDGKLQALSSNICLEGKTAFHEGLSRILEEYDVM